MWTLVWLMTIVLSSHDGKEPTDRLVPDGWQGNPWGPGALEARRTGVIPPVPMTPLMTQWDAWGKSVLKDGDVLFRRGDATLLLGRFPFSRFTARVSGSQFSHTGIVAIEDGEPFVYDTTKAGVRRPKQIDAGDVMWTHMRDSVCRGGRPPAAAATADSIGRRISNSRGLSAR